MPDNINCLYLWELAKANPTGYKAVINHYGMPASVLKKRIKREGFKITEQDIINILSNQIN